MKKYLIALLLLPAMLLGADDKVAATTAEKVEVVIVDDSPEQPDSTYDRVSWRKKDVVFFEHDSIGSGIIEAHISPTPIHYDSCGKWARYRYDITETEESKLAAADLVAERKTVTKVEFDREANVGPFGFRHLSSWPGRWEFSKRGTTLGFYPADSLHTIYTLSSEGVEEVVVLTSESPTRIACGYLLTGNDPTRKLMEGQPIYGADGMINGFFPHITAVDQRGEPVPNTVEINEDSIIVTYPAIAAGDTVFHDPPVQDSVPSPLLGGYARTSQMPWPAVRDTTAAEEAGSAYTGKYVGTYPWTGGSYACRNFYLWRLDDITGLDGATIDSAIYRQKVTTVAGTSPTHEFFLVLGSQGTGAITTQSFNDIPGWAAGIPTDTFDVVKLTESSGTIPSSANGTFIDMYFTEAGRDTLLAHAGDTLQTVLMDGPDINAARDEITGANGTGSFTPGVSRLVIYFTTGSPPGVSISHSEEIAEVILAIDAYVDSTGGDTPDSVMTEAFPIGDNSDTLRNGKGGSFPVGAFTAPTALLTEGENYAVRVGLHDAVAWSWTVWDTVSATASGGGSFIVAGRKVNWAK